MKPRKNYRTRPKKSGARKKQKVSCQKRRLVKAGCKKEDLDKMTTVEVRELLKKTGKKKRGPSKAKPAKAKKASPKKKAKS